MKKFRILLIFLFASTSIANGQKVLIVTTDLFTKNEVKYPNRNDSMPSYLVYDTIAYSQNFPFNYYKRHKGFERYEFTLIGWFLKSKKINALYPFQNFVHGVIIDKVEHTQANYPFVAQGDGKNGLNEVLYIGRIHMELNPKGAHDYIHYTGYLKNGIPDLYGSYDHLTYNGVGGLMLIDCEYKGNVAMAKRNGEGCYSNGQPIIARKILEYDRSHLSGMNNDNVKYGIPIVSICGTYRMDTLVYAHYTYEDGSYFEGTIDMPYIFPGAYYHYYSDFNLKGNGTFTMSNGNKVTGQFQYPYIYSNSQWNLVANPNNIQREVYVSPSYKLCTVCGGGGLVSKGVTTSGGVITLDKKDVGNGYVQYSTNRNAPATFYSLKQCSSCINGRVKTSEGYTNKVSINK